MSRIHLALALVGCALPTIAAAQSAAPQTISRASYLAERDKEFAVVDANKDGTLSSAEIDAARTKAAAALAQARANAMFRQLDADKNGSLSPAEFAKGIDPAKIKLSAAPILGYDANRDGKVTQAEYRAGSGTRFDQIDTNKDGKVTEAEAKAVADKNSTDRR